MVTENDIQYMEVTKEDIYNAMNQAKKHDFIDNLRERNVFVQFDSKVRGYLGEIVITKLLQDSDITIESSDEYKVGSNEDIDIKISTANSQNIVVEIKTSLIPDGWRTLKKTIEEADIKIIKRENSFYEIKADIYIQIYYNFLREERNNYLSGLQEDIDKLDLNALYKLLNYESLQAFFVAWIDKKTLCSNLACTKNKVWGFKKRLFWKCPLAKAKKPIDLLSGLQNYKK